MYGKENEGSITKIVITMLLIVLVIMVGYSFYKVENSEVIPKENEIRVLKVENWDDNIKSFEIDALEQIEFVLDAGGSNTDVNYKVTLSLENSENIKLYNDEYHLYETEDVLTGTIKYKETMKETITLYIENNSINSTEPSEDVTFKPILNVKVEVVEN